MHNFLNNNAFHSDTYRPLITVGWSFSGGMRVSLTETPWTETPLTETPGTATLFHGRRSLPWTETPSMDRDSPPWTETPSMDRDPPPWTETPGQRHPLDRDPHGQRPPGHVTCDACWDRETPPRGPTNTCENITLPQTSFLGCKLDLEYIKQYSHHIFSEQ